MSLGHARSDRAHTRFGHQFHCDASLRIDIFQVVDQLREIFNGINVVMRRRRNQPHAGDGVPQASNHFVHLVTRKLAALAGFRALRHLDLQLVALTR